MPLTVSLGNCARSLVFRGFCFWFLFTGLIYFVFVNSTAIERIKRLSQDRKSNLEHYGYISHVNMIRSIIQLSLAHREHVDISQAVIAVYLSNVHWLARMELNIHCVSSTCEKGYLHTMTAVILQLSEGLCAMTDFFTIPLYNAAVSKAVRNDWFRSNSAKTASGPWYWILWSV